MKKQHRKNNHGVSWKLKRRDFIKGSLFAGAGMVLGREALFPSDPIKEKTHSGQQKSNVMMKVLGTAQDGGLPQIGCYCENCCAARKNPEIARKVVSLGILNFATGKSFMIEATPDAARQVEMIHAVEPRFKRDRAEGNPIDGLLLTHADVGHYTGLVQFRPEITPVRNLPVYCTPIMAKFLSDNEPWKFMVRRHIIELRTFDFNKKVVLDDGVEFEAIKVPHDKHSDMAGFKIFGPDKTLLFIPDIDQWEERFQSIVDSVDYAFIDATFYSNRRGSKRHPLITKSMEFFKNIIKDGKPAIYFIHFNHSNPVLGKDKSIRKSIEAKGFHVADDGQKIWL